MNQSTIVVLAGITIVALIFWYVATEIDRRKRNVGTALVALVVTLCVIAITPPKEKLKGGIDLIGGSAFTVQVNPGEENGIPLPVDEKAVEAVKEILGSRLSASGLADNLIQPLGKDRLIIEMPGIKPEDSERVREIIQKTVVLQLKKVHPQTNSLAQRVKDGSELPPAGFKLFEERNMDEKTGEKLPSNPILLSRRNIVTGDQIQSARKSPGELGVAHVRLSSEGGERMLNATGEMKIGTDRMAVVLNGTCVVSPTVQAVLNRDFTISGLYGKDEVETVAAALANPLKNSLQILSHRSITPKLGAAAVKQGINAAIACLVLTLIFVLLYYRIAGIVALIGLAVNILILFGAMAMFGATFTLPGIAGIILTIGVAVDANVLIYERLREELAAGKSIKSAIKSAYEKAFSAIFDANITTLLTALILFWRASDQVQGFAITLTIGILASMFAALVATRVFFYWGTDTNTFKKLEFMNLVPNRIIDFMGKRSPAFIISAVLLLISLATVGIKRDKSLGIDFLGGTLISIQLDADQKLEVDEVTSSLSDLALEKKPYVQKESVPGGGGDLIVIRCGETDAPAVSAELKKDISLLSQGVDLSQDTIKASLGGEFLVNSLIALGLGLLAVLVYISLRFEFSFAVGAFAALFHDIIICVGIVMLVGTELSLIHVGAFLTIAGYSINDTIVVFDRIREALRSERGDVVTIMNKAINSTLSRTILTSVTTFVAVLVLYIFGGSALKDFSFAIMVGVIVGTYSSIFVASPAVYLWSQKRGTNLRKELLDAGLENEMKQVTS